MVSKKPQNLGFRQTAYLPTPRPTLATSWFSSTAGSGSVGGGG